MKQANPYLILGAMLLALAAWLIFTGRLDSLYLRLVGGEAPAPGQEPAGPGEEPAGPGEEPAGPGEEPAADRLDCDLYLRNGVCDRDEVAILQSPERPQARRAPRRKSRRRGRRRARPRTLARLFQRIRP